MHWLQQTIHSEARGVFIYFITRTGTVLWSLSSSSSIIESATRLDCCSTFTFRKEQLIHHNRFIQLIEGNDWFPFAPALTSLHSKVHIQKLICCTTFWQKSTNQTLLIALPSTKPDPYARFQPFQSSGERRKKRRGYSLLSNSGHENWTKVARVQFCAEIEKVLETERTWPQNRIFKPKTLSRSPPNISYFVCIQPFFQNTLSLYG